MFCIAYGVSLVKGHFWPLKRSSSGPWTRSGQGGSKKVAKRKHRVAKRKQWVAKREQKGSKVRAKGEQWGRSRAREDAKRTQKGRKKDAKMTQKGRQNDAK